jgi:predicted RNA-binding Zn-ribbon protein involved in translation (DUF1610 family)
MIQVKSHKDKDGGEYNWSYISENCTICGKELMDIDDIYVDELDHYICEKCGDNHNIQSKKCKDLSF